MHRTNQTVLDIVNDITALVFSFIAAELLAAKGNYPMSIRTIWVLVFYSSLFIAFFTLFEMYRVTLFDYKCIIVTVVLTSLYSGILCWGFAALLYLSLSHTVFVAAYTLLSMVFVGVWRVLSYRNMTVRKTKPKMLILAESMEDNSRVRKIKYASAKKFDSWYEQINLTDEKDIEKVIGMFGRYDIICLMDSIPLTIRDILVQAAINSGRELLLVSTAYDIGFSHPRLALFDDVLIFRIGVRSMTVFEQSAKRFFDIIVSLVGIAVSALPMLVVAVAVKTTSKGPVLYRQERLTKDKKIFRIIKFRTMCADSEKLTGPVFARKDDPRITKVGRVLRKCRLDELPQFFNILAGDMSVVGPRPERPFFVGEFEKVVCDYDRRFAVKAGLTSLSHVYGRYSTDIVDRTMCDFFYISNFSLLLDLKIILLTTRVVFLGEAAEGLDSGFKYGAGTKKDIPSLV